MEQDKEALLDLLLAVNIFIISRQSQTNRFVKRFGKETFEEQESMDILTRAFEEAEYLLPEAEDRIIVEDLEADV